MEKKKAIGREVMTPGRALEENETEGGSLEEKKIFAD